VLKWNILRLNVHVLGYLGVDNDSGVEMSWILHVRCWNSYNNERSGILIICFESLKSVKSKNGEKDSLTTI